MIPRSALVSAWNQTPFRSDFLRALKSSSFAVRHPSSASNPLVILWRFDEGNVVTGGVLNWTGTLELLLNESVSSPSFIQKTLLERGRTKVRVGGHLCGRSLYLRLFRFCWSSLKAVSRFFMTIFLSWSAGMDFETHSPTTVTPVFFPLGV